MATNPFPPAAAALIAARILNRHSIGEIAQAIDVLMDVLDIADGDPDFEAGGDDEPRFADGDTKDVTYAEWTSLRGKERGRCYWVSDHEDDEEDDHDEDGHDQEAIDEREEPIADACENAPIWPGEGSL